MSIKLTQNTEKKIKHKFVMRGKGRALRISLNKVLYTFDSHDARVLIDANSLAFLNGSHINLAIEGFKKIFTFDNFNIYSESGHSESFNLKKSKFGVKDAMVIL
jgi:iron-sulfur cluster assembly protein